MRRNTRGKSTAALSDGSASGAHRGSVAIPAPKPIAAAVAVALLALGGAHSGLVFAAPIGGQVVGGAATIQQPNAQTTLIQQSTQRAALNWTSFGIGSNESVIFQQPSASAVALNRVVGPDPSVIYGHLQANGQVFLINPSGVLFARGASVDVGGLVASTLGISNADFMAGKYVFSGGSNAGAVVNHANIRAANGGYVALLGNQVTNTGTISATGGTVALGAGDTMQLDFHGDGLLTLKVDAAAAKAKIEHGGIIEADGGQVFMTVRAKQALMATAINIDGIITAKGLVERNGRIYLDGGSSGVTSVSGKLDASSNVPGQKGGGIRVLGEYVGLFGNAMLDASGAGGGGTVLVGGDLQGKNPDVQNAFRTYVGPDATIKADAITNGDGGKVIVWADDWTKFHGQISARGGEQGGDGGFAEVSGKQALAFTGRADLGAPAGKLGTLLLDPLNITIQAAGNAGDDLEVAVDGTINFAERAGDSLLLTAAVLNGAPSANIALQATNDISVNAALTRAAGNITLQAGNNIDVNSAITANTGSVMLTANDPGGPASGSGTVTVGAAVSASAGTVAITNNGSTAALAIGANLNGATVNLTAGAGGISQTAGTITAATLNATSAGTINQSAGNMVVSGATTLTADTNAITASLTSGTNNFNTVTLATAGGSFTTASVSDGVDAMSIGGSAGTLTASAIGQLTLTGGTYTTLNATSQTGIDQSTAPLIVSGVTTLTSNAATITADLSTQANNFGTVTLVDGTGTFGTVSLNDINAIQLGTINTANDLTVTAVGITQDATSVIVGGVSTFNGGAGVITLTDADNNFTGAVNANNTGANAIALTDVDAITLGTINTANNLTVTAVGITQDATSITVGGVSTFNGGAGVITLTDADNNFTGAVNANNTGANAIQLTDTNAIQLGTVNTANNLTVTAVGITQDATSITVGGVSTFNGGAGVITLTDADNNFTGAVNANNTGANAIALTDVDAITLGTINTANNLTVTAVGITQDATSITVGGVSTFNGGAGAITLTDADNNFTGAVNANNTGANAIALTDVDAITLGTINTANNLTVTAVGITQDATSITVGGVSTFNGGAGVITLTDADNNFTGAVNANNTGANAIALTDVDAITLGTINTANNLTVTAVGITQDATSITVGGVSTFNGGAGVITLTDADNNFTGAVNANNTGANAIALTDVDAITLGTINTADNLTVTAVGITQDATSITVGGVSTFNGGAGVITLTDADNNFTGAVNANNTGANAIALTDVDAITLGTVNTANDLTVTAVGITQDATSVTVGGVSTFNGGAGVITLTDADNNFTGAVNANNTGANAIQLTDTNAITLGTINTANNLTVTAVGITQDATSITVGGVSTFNGGAGVITLTDVDNNFTGAVNANNTGANAIQLTDANAIQLGTVNTANNLTVTAVGITQDATSITVGGVSTFNGGAGVITLTDVDNDFTGAVNANNTGANAIQLTDATAIQLGTVNTANDLTVTAVGITQDATSITVGGVSTFNGGAGVITLTDADNNFTGAVNANNTGANAIQLTDATAIQLGTVNTANDLTVTAVGITQDATSITVGGVSTFNGGAGVITLTDADNNFTGAVNANNTGANAIQLTDATAIQLGTVNTANNLTVTAVGITQDATSITVGGVSTFNGGAGVITLTDANNDFTGAVNANNTGANAIQLTDANAIQLGTVNTANNLTVTAVGITQDATSITVGGVSTFNGGAGVITLTDANNDFTGAVNANNSGANAIQLTDANAIQLGTVSTANELIVTADDIAVTGAVSAPGQAVTFRPLTAGRTIALGTEVAGSLSLTDTELDQITTATLRIGRNDAPNASGAITVTQNVSPANLSTLHLMTGSSITGTAGGISVPGLVLEAASANLDHPFNDVITIAANITPAGNAFRYLGDSDDVVVGTLAGIPGITTNGGAVTIVTGGALTLASPITAGAATVTLNAGSIAQNAGAGITAETLTGRATLGRAVLDKNNAITFLGEFETNDGFTLNDIGGGLTLTGAINTAANGTTNAVVITTTGGPLALQSNRIFAVGGVTLQGEGVTSTGGGISTVSIFLGAMPAGAVQVIATGAGAIDLAGGVRTVGRESAGLTAGAGGDVTFTTANGAISVGSVNTSGGLGDGASTNAGDAGTIVFNVGGGNALTLNGDLISRGGNATGSGKAGAGRDLTISAPTRLGADVLIATGRGTGAGAAPAGNVTFSNTIESPTTTPRTLTVNTGGTTTFAAAIGGNGNPLASITTGAGGTTAINGGAVTTTGAQTYNDAVTLGAANTVLTSTGNQAIAFASTLDGASNLTVTTGGLTTFSGVVGGGPALTSLTSNGGGTTAIDGGAVTTTGAQTYTDAITLGGANTVLTSTGDQAIALASAVDGASNLTVTTGGLTTFGGAVGAGSALASLTTNGGGTTAINGGALATTGAQTYSDAVTLGTANTVLTSTGNQAIAFAGTVDGASNLTVATGGVTTFGGPLGSGTALTSITTDGPGATTIAGNSIMTSGNQAYGDPVTLAANGTLTSNNGNISFAGTVNADAAANNRKLVVNASNGTVTFSGNIGDTAALADLDVTAGPATIVFNAASAQTVNVSAQGGNTATFNTPVVLSQNLTVNTDGAADNNVTFASTVNSDAVADRTLAVTTGTGTATFSNGAGTTQELGGLTVSGNQLVVSGDIRVNGGGAVDFTNLANLSFTPDAVIDTDRTGGTTAGGNILFGATTAANPAATDATWTLDANADGGAAAGNVQLGTIGNLTGLDVLNITGNTVTFAGPVNARQVFVTANKVETTGDGRIFATRQFGGETSETSAALSLSGLTTEGTFGLRSTPIEIDVPGLFIVFPNGSNTLLPVFLAGDPDKKPVYPFADDPSRRQVFYNGTAPDSPASRAALSAITQQLRQLLDEINQAGFSKENIRKQLLQGLILETGLSRPGIDQFVGEGVTLPQSCNAVVTAGGALACQ